jgi:hypothetical protein
MLPESVMVCHPALLLRAQGDAVLRVAAELRDFLLGECEACRHRVPRNLVWGTQDAYVHHYGGDPGTVAPCESKVPPSLLSDLDKMEAVGRWLVSAQTISLPIRSPGIPAAGHAASGFTAGATCS